MVSIANDCDCFNLARIVRSTTENFVKRGVLKNSCYENLQRRQKVTEL